jgi:ABC-type uncharacterized transport system involved in gliding motility auxiliary subunit
MTRSRTRRVVLLAGAVVAIAAVNVVLAASTAQVDLSANRRFSLASESKAVARAVDAPMKVTAFLYDSGGIARDARFLLARYHEINHRITYRIVDPDADPAEAKRFNIDQYSTLVFEYRGRRLDATSVDELQISSTILRLVRGRTHQVCALTGHGEADLADDSPDGLSKLGQLLADNGYVVATLDLATQTSVPASCDAVVVAGPSVAMTPGEVDALTRYTQAAGRLMVLANPFFQEADPNPLIQPWGVTFVGCCAVDPAHARGADISDVIVDNFPSVNPVDNGVPSLDFPAPGGLVVPESTRDGLTVSRLATTSAQGWVETNIDTEVVFNAGDFPGPVVLAAAADDSGVVGSGSSAHIERTRVFVAGGSVWATNQFIDLLGNRRFILNAFNWLTEEEQLLTVATAPPQPRDFPWTPAREREVLLVTVGLVPGAVIAVGLGRWLVGRRRLAHA